MRQWIRYLVGRVLPTRRLTVDDLRADSRLRWGWRATEIRSDVGDVVANVPPPSKPGHIGPFPVSDGGKEKRGRINPEAGGPNPMMYRPSRVSDGGEDAE